MQSFKETYFTPDQFPLEVSRLRAEIDSMPVRKREWTADISDTALIVTDLQNYFLLPESHAYIPSAKAILPNILMLIEFFRKNKRPLIFTRHINNQQNAGSMAWWWNDLIDETVGYSHLHEVIYTQDDTVLSKNQYDAFAGTSLENILHSSLVRYPVICGVMANLCCETTARTAFVKGFRPVLPLDATATYTRELHLATFRNLAFGFMPVLTTVEVINIIAK